MNKSCLTHMSSDHYFRDFISSRANWFDVFIVTCQLISIFINVRFHVSCEWGTSHVWTSHGFDIFIVTCQLTSIFILIIGLICRIWSLSLGSFAKRPVILYMDLISSSSYFSSPPFLSTYVFIPRTFSYKLVTFSYKLVTFSYKLVMPHIWITHFMRRNDSCHTYETWVMSHIWRSHGFDVFTFTCQLTSILILTIGLFCRISSLS